MEVRMKQKYVLFGAGIAGTGAVNYFDKDHIVAIIDNYPDKIGTLFEGIRVISFSEYLDKYKGLQVIISICSKHYFNAKKQLEEAGIYDYFTAPPVLWGFDLPEKFAMDLSHFKLNNIVLYGVNPISIRIFEWLKENKGIECDFVLTEKEKKIPDYAMLHTLKTLNDLSEDDIVVVTTSEVEEHIREVMKARFKGEIYDIYEKSTSLQHKELYIYKDKYKGKRCFIIGNGPSLQMHDLDKIDEFNEISFGSNRIYLSFKKTRWRPTYYVIADLIGMEPDYDYIQEYENETFFVADYYYTQLHKYKNANHYTVLNQIYENGIRFSDDMVRGIASGRTVTYQMIQIACYMGFKEIILLGVDFSWGENGSNTHFCSDYLNNQEEQYQRKHGIVDKDEIYQAYLAAKTYASQHNIQIYNATRGGCLDVFDRVDFDGVFEKVGDDI